MINGARTKPFHDCNLFPSDSNTHCDRIADQENGYCQKNRDDNNRYIPYQLVHAVQCIGYGI